MLYQNEKRQKFIKKIYENVVCRKSVYFRRNLSINGKQTNVKIIKIKKDFNRIICGLNSNSDDICLLIEHQNKIELDNLNNTLDMIGTNYKGTVLIEKKLIPNQKNLIDWEEIGVKNIWILKEGWTKRLEIKINSNVSTKSNI